MKASTANTNSNSGVTHSDDTQTCEMYDLLHLISGSTNVNVLKAS